MSISGHSENSLLNVIKCLSVLIETCLLMRATNDFMQGVRTPGAFIRVKVHHGGLISSLCNSVLSSLLLFFFLPFYTCAN